MPNRRSSTQADKDITNGFIDPSLISVNGSLETTFTRILSNKNVEGLILLNKEGATLKSSFDSTLTKKYSMLTKQLTSQSTSLVRDLDPTNGLSYIRMICKKQEIMIAPDDNYLLIVVQNLQEI